MSTPPTFKLEAINPQTRPPPAPPRYLKKQIYQDPSVFQKIDEHAVNVCFTNFEIKNNLESMLISNVTLFTFLSLYILLL